ncbi:MAG: hypothetical protein IPM82_28075 [Saprospiraceae bacterium]|nr:hypothetical protein [Saprospiraceae bacterium]
MKAFFVSTAVLVALLTCCSLNEIQAQSGALSGAGGAVDKTPKPDYCELVLPKVERELKADANATCTTQSACVECMDKASKIILAATLVVQPDKEGCKPATDITTEDAAISRGAQKQKPASFRAQILQSPCYAGGTNLEVYIAGYGQTSREFSYLWEIDGKKGGHLPKQTCICGKLAKVRVTHLATGESVTLNMRLNSTCASTGK